MSAQTVPPAPPRPRLLTTAEFKALSRTEPPGRSCTRGCWSRCRRRPSATPGWPTASGTALAGARPGWEALTGLGCELVPGSRDAGTGLRDTVVEPDVAVLPAAALDAVPEEEYLPGAPRWRWRWCPPATAWRG